MKFTTLTTLCMLALGVYAQDGSSTVEDSATILPIPTTSDSGVLEPTSDVFSSPTSVPPSSSISVLPSVSSTLLSSVSSSSSTRRSTTTPAPSSTIRPSSSEGPKSTITAPPNSAFNLAAGPHGLVAGLVAGVALVLL